MTGMLSGSVCISRFSGERTCAVAPAARRTEQARTVADGSGEVSVAAACRSLEHCLVTSCFPC